MKKMKKMKRKKKGYRPENLVVYIPYCYCYIQNSEHGNS